MRGEKRADEEQISVSFSARFFLSPRLIFRGKSVARNTGARKKRGKGKGETMWKREKYQAQEANPRRHVVVVVVVVSRDVTIQCASSRGTILLPFL